MGKRIRCEEYSSLYREIVNSKYNGKVLEDGGIRIGRDYYLDVKINRICSIR